MRPESGRIEATPQGRMLLRNIATCFDADLDPAAASHRASHARSEPNGPGAAANEGGRT